MARYGYGSHSSYRSPTGRSSGGFTNARTGRYVSPARAHQHTGQSFGGYTKAKSASSGNWYMKRS